MQTVIVHSQLLQENLKVRVNCKSEAEAQARAQFRIRHWEASLTPEQIQDFRSAQIARDFRALKAYDAFTKLLNA